jgi:hypothetical protein
VPEGNTPPLFARGLLNTEIEVNEPIFFGDLAEHLVIPPAGAVVAHLTAASDPATRPPVAPPPKQAPQPEPAKTAEPPPTAARMPTPTPRRKNAPPAEPAETGESTTLTATAYIGIGNKLFIRGNAGGLTLERGEPLQFISIGKWRWQSTALTKPIQVTLWKNDEIRCEALGEIEVLPGTSSEVTATF